MRYALISDIHANLPALEGIAPILGLRGDDNQPGSTGNAIRSMLNWSAASGKGDGLGAQSNR
jgi:hypothetical protein